MDREQVEVGALIQRIWHAVCAAPGASFAFIFVMSALGIYSDMYFGESPGIVLLVSVANFVAGFFLMLAILRAVGLRREGEGGGFGAFFVVSFLSGLGMMAGFLLLIVPGVILMVRWSPALALVLSEDEAGSDALGESWRMTEGLFWPIFAATLVGLVPIVLAVAILSSGWVLADSADLAVAPPLWESITLNFVMSTYSVYSTGLGIAIYWMLRGTRSGLTETFA